MRRPSPLGGAALQYDTTLPLPRVGPVVIIVILVDRPTPLGPPGWQGGPLLLASAAPEPAQRRDRTSLMTSPLPYLVLALSLVIAAPAPAQQVQPSPRVG